MAPKSRVRVPVWLDPRDRHYLFPRQNLALRDPNGMLAIGGDLSSGRLLAAYRRGIFPWYSDDQPILWWTPDPRAVLFPSQLKISRSLAKAMRKGMYTVTIDQSFRRVMEECAQTRKDGLGTWITEEMIDAYCTLHDLGYAHSIEAWTDGELAGGLYGVAIGRTFYGESMFTRRTDASKVAFVHLVRQLERWGFGLIDCQVGSSHLASLGAVEVPRETFLALLDRYCEQPHLPGPWKIASEAAEIEV